MSKALPVVFGAIIVAGLGVYDYLHVSRQQATAAALGLGAPQGYIASLKDRLLPVGAQAEPVNLVDHLGEPLRGWDRAPYDLADGERLAGQAIEAPEALRSTTNDLLHRLRLAASEAGSSLQTYEKNEEIVILGLMRGGSAAQGDVVRADYAMLRGLPLALLEAVDIDAATGQRNEAPYRRLVGAIGPGAELLVLTTAGDEAVVQVLATLDLPGLAEALGVQIPGLSEEKPVFAGTAVERAPLAVPEAEDDDKMAVADAPKGPCIRRGTVLSCE